MNRNTSSYLSSSVRHLLRLSFENCRDTSLNNQALQCLRKEGQVLVFEDQPIQCLLGNVIIDDYSQRTGQWYKSVLRRLSPLFNYCHDMINREPFKKDIVQDDFLKWLTHPALVYEAISMLQSRDDKNVANEVILSLTPMLERSLGDILFTYNKKLKIPSLLRDLINTQELFDAIKSPILMLLLHVMIGTPQGLNLRNLAWHGFPRPGEISPILASSLIVLIFSIGEALISNKYDQVEHRTSVDLLGQKGLMSKIEAIYGSIPYTVDEISDTFMHMLQPDDPKGPVLQRVHKLLSKNKFRQALYLLIPEWECQARLLFTLVNTCPSRSLTAEDSRLYLTFDEILSKIRVDADEPSKEIENLFPVTIGDPHMEYLIDCLILPEGPRLRDKISHGELDLNEDMTSSVFRMCIYVIMASFNDLEQYLSSSSSTKYLSDYSALFHPKRLLIEEIDEVTIQVQNLSEHPSLYETQDLGNFKKK